MWIAILSSLIIVAITHSLPFWAAVSSADALVSGIEILQFGPLKEHLVPQQSMPRRLLLLSILFSTHTLLSIVFWTNLFLPVFQWLTLVLAASPWIQQRCMMKLEPRAISVAVDILAQVATAILVLDSPELDFNTTRSRLLLLLGGTWTWPRLIQQCLWPDKGWKELYRFFLVLRKQHPLILSLVSETCCLYTMGSLFNHAGISISSFIIYCRRTTNGIQEGFDPKAGHQPSQNFAITVMVHGAAFVFQFPVWLHIGLAQLCPLFYQHLPWKQYLSPRKIRIQIALLLAHCLIGQHRLWAVMLAQGLLLSVLEEKPDLLLSSLSCASLGWLSNYHPLQLSVLCLMSYYYMPLLLEKYHLLAYFQDEQIGTWISEIIRTDSDYFASKPQISDGAVLQDYSLSNDNIQYHFHLDKQQWEVWKRRSD